ncbi:MAG: hypothetical protein ACJ760_09535 [Thermoleophilaceae bacterium]
MDLLAARRAPLLGVLVAAAAVLTLLLGAQQAHAIVACSTSWTAGSGNWNDAANWSAGVPDASDVACITSDGDKQIMIQAQDGNETNATAIAKELHLGGASGTQSILISGESFGTPTAVDYPANLTLVGGAGSASDIGPNGKIFIQAGSGANAGICAGSPLTNSGEIQTLGGFGTGPRTLGGNIKNQGTLNIKINTDVPSTQSCGPNVLENSGDVTGAISRTLTVGGTYKQTAGTTGPEKVVVDGGHLAPSGGTGTIHVRGASSLDSDVGEGINVNVEGSATEDALVTTAAAMTNAGTIALTDLGGSHGSTLRASGGKLTNTGALSTVVGSGGARHLGKTIENQGTMQIGADTSSEGDPNTLALTSSAGEFDVLAGAKLTLSNFTETGGGAGIYGRLDDSGNPTVSGGRLEGDGLIKAGTFANTGGTVDPGDGVGQLTVDGNYTQGSGGTLAVKIQGPNPASDFDLLVVTGTATLGGTLTANTVGAQHDTYPVVQAQQVTGTFDVYGFSGQSYGVVTSSTAVTLVAAPFNTTRPAITGLPRVGNVLSCTNGIWVPQGSPLTYVYRWLRDGVPIASTTATRKVAAADQGHKLGCRVTATNVAGSTPATSNPRAVPREPVDRGTFPKKTLRATKAGDVLVPVRNPNPLGTGGLLTLRNAKGKVVGSAKFTIGARATKTVKVHLTSGPLSKLIAKGQLKLHATLVLSKGTVKRTTKTALTVKKPKP